VRIVPRPYWKGFLKLSLVTCPVEIYPAASSTERISFRQINKKTGNRLRQQLVDEVTRLPVEAADKGRGYEVDKDQYLLIEDNEIEELEIESSKAIDIDTFVPSAQIDKRYYDSPYYIVPGDEVGQEAFAVIREAMRGKGMVALARIVLAKRERVIALEPFGKGLLGTTLRYGYEVRKAEDYFSDIADIKIDKELRELAEHILKKKEADFDPTEFRDHYEEALTEFIRKKQDKVPALKGKSATPVATNVINLMDALRRSVAGTKGTTNEKSAATPAKKGKKRVAGQSEMLLPISGKGGAKVVRAAKTEKAEKAPRAASPKKAARR
jgi:DNA end-binding protein Ku